MTSLIVVISPGTGVLYTLAAALSRGSRARVIAAVHPLTHMLLLSWVFMAMTLIVFVAYGLLASRAREQIVSRPRVMSWMHRTFAAAFVALAAKLALTER